MSDPSLADREWSDNTDLTKAPTDVIERSASGVTPSVTQPVTPVTGVTPLTGPEAVPLERLSVWQWENGLFGLVVCRDEDSTPEPGDPAIAMSVDDAVAVGPMAGASALPSRRGEDL